MLDVQMSQINYHAVMPSDVGHTDASNGQRDEGCTCRTTPMRREMGGYSWRFTVDPHWKAFIERLLTLDLVGEARASAERLSDAAFATRKDGSRTATPSTQRCG